MLICRIRREVGPWLRALSCRIRRGDGPNQLARAGLSNSSWSRAKSVGELICRHRLILTGEVIYPRRELDLARLSTNPGRSAGLGAVDLPSSSRCSRLFCVRRHIVRLPSASAVPSRGALRLIVASRPFTARSIKIPLDDDGSLASKSPYNASGWQLP